jgi:hypothetical protein
MAAKPMAAFHPLLPIADQIRMSRSRPEAVVPPAFCSIRELALADEASEPHDTLVPEVVKRRVATLTQSSICEFAAESTLGTPNGICATKMDASGENRVFGRPSRAESQNVN